MKSLNSQEIRMLHVSKHPSRQNLNPQYSQNKQAQYQKEHLRRVKSVHLKKPVLATNMQSPPTIYTSSNPVLRKTCTEVSSRLAFEPNHSPFQTQVQPQRRRFQSHHRFQSVQAPPDQTNLQSKLTEIKHRSTNSINSQQYNEQHYDSMLPNLSSNHQSFNCKQSTHLISIKALPIINWSQSNIYVQPSIKDLPENQLITLNLDNNYINVIDQPMPRGLIKLSLEGNQLDQIDLTLISQSAVKLRELNLSKNNIKKLIIHKATLFQSLRVLNMSQNQLKDKETEKMMGRVKFYKLKKIDLSGNQLINTAVLVMSNLENTLQECNLSANQISGVIEIKGLNKLKLLNLGENRLNGVVISNLPNLQFLNLENNQLEFIDLQSELTKLKKILLRTNLLEESDNILTLLKYSPSLKHLDLGCNQFVTLNTLNHQILQTFQLDDNPNLSLDSLTNWHLPSLSSLSLSEHQYNNQYLQNCFPNLTHLNGQNIIKPQRSKSFARLPPHSSNLSTSNPYIEQYHQTQSLEFSITQPSIEAKSIKHLRRKQQTSQEEIFNSQVIKFNQQHNHSINNNKQMTVQSHQRVQDQFISKRISYVNTPTPHQIIQQNEQASQDNNEIQESDIESKRERLRYLKEVEQQIKDLTQQFTVKYSNPKEKTCKLQSVTSQLVDLFETSLIQVRNQLTKGYVPCESPSLTTVESYHQESNRMNQTQKLLPYQSNHDSEPEILQYQEQNYQLDYENVLILLSTPISLLVQTYKDLSAKELIEEICQTIGNETSQFQVSKLMFENQEEVKQMEEIINQANDTRLSLDSYVIKSNILKQILSHQIQNLGQQNQLDQWAVIKNLREKVMHRLSQPRSNINQFELQPHLTSEAIENNSPPTQNPEPIYIITTPNTQDEQPYMQQNDQQQVIEQEHSSLKSLPLKFKQALDELLLYSRHPLCQITLEQANYTFQDDITPTNNNNNKDENQEGLLVKYLMKQINQNQFKLNKVIKVYNYSKIQSFGSEGLVLMFAKRRNSQKNVEMIGQDDLIMSNSLISIEAINQKQNEELQKQCLVVIIRQESLKKAIIDEETEQLKEGWRAKKEVTFIEKLNIYQVSKNSIQNVLLPVYIIDYTSLV